MNRAEALEFAVETLGAEVVGEKTIEHRDEYGGYAWDVLDYEVSKKRRRRYLVLALDDDDLVEHKVYPEYL